MGDPAMDDVKQVRIGDRVRVTFTATVVNVYHTQGILLGVDGAGDCDADDVRINPGCLPHIDIERLEPADGMPQIGDMWGCHHGVVWAAVANPKVRTGDLSIAMGGVRDAVVFVTANSGEFVRWEDADRDYGPIRLLFRPTASEPS